MKINDTTTESVGALSTESGQEEEDEYSQVFVLYFIICTVVFAMLIFIAVRKTIKLSFSNVFYGEPKTKPLPEEVRIGAKDGFHPASMFKAPTVLHKLQASGI